MSKLYKTYRNNPFEKSHKREKHLGHGAFGEVYLYVNDKGALAIKSFKEGPDSKDEFLFEVEGYKKVGKHEHIVEFIQAFCVDEEYFIVMEYFKNGDLSKIYEDFQEYTEKDVRDVIVQVSKGLAYMNKKKLAHRDIKPDNIFVRSWEPISVAVGDLNFSKKVKGSRMTVLVSNLGSGQYKAPEVVDTTKRRGGNFYNQKCDVWSLGVVLYQLLSGRDDPYGINRVDLESIRSKADMSETEKLKEIGDRLQELKDKPTVSLPKTPQWQKISKEGKTMVTRMLTTDYNKRIDFPEIITSAWAKKKFDEDSLEELYDPDRYEQEQRAREEALSRHLTRG